MRALAGLLAAVVWTSGIVHAYPIAQERELGERFAIEAAGALPLLREPAVLDYVNRIGQSIVAKLEPPQPFEYRFSVVQDSGLNAFAVPGGFIYVNSGLFTRVASVSELAGVVGHEIGHTHAHHIIRQQEKSRLFSYAAVAGMLLSILHPAIGAAAAGAGATAQLKFSREFEQEADYLGTRYMRAAGYDPHGMPRFMKRILEEQRTNPTDLPPYMLSHPLTDERISNLEAATRNLPRNPAAEKPDWALERVQAIVYGLTGDRANIRGHYQKESTKSPRALALYGIVLLYQNDPAAALAALEGAKAQGVGGLEGDLGLARFRSGDLDGAALVLRAGIEKAPDDALARALLGKVLLAKGDYPGAVRELSAALDEGPDLDDVENDLGQALGRSGDPARGVLHLARAFEMRGDAERALAQYEKAGKLLEANSAEAEECKRKVEWLEEIRTRRRIGR